MSGDNFLHLLTNSFEHAAGTVQFNYSLDHMQVRDVNNLICKELASRTKHQRAALLSGRYWSVQQSVQTVREGPTRNTGGLIDELDSITRKILTELT